jgi:ZIP family zinc transporter
MKVTLWIGLAGYGAALAGHLAGCLFALASKKQNNRLHGTLMGFTAGLLIAFVCFEILPPVLDGGARQLYAGIAAILAGVAVSAWMEGRLNHLSRWQKVSLLLTFGLSLHHVPEGVALGSILHTSVSAGASFALMIGIHCFPETFAVALPMKQAGYSAAKILLIPFLLALPMGLGALAGSWISASAHPLIHLCLGFASGVMLYITCGDILPESRDLWRGRLTVVGAMLGFVIGIWLTEIL